MNSMIDMLQDVLPGLKSVQPGTKYSNTLSALADQDEALRALLQEDCVTLYERVDQLHADLRVACENKYFAHGYFGGAIHGRGILPQTGHVRFSDHTMPHKKEAALRPLSLSKKSVTGMKAQY